MGAERRPRETLVYSVEEARAILPQVRAVARQVASRLAVLGLEWRQDPVSFRAIEANADLGASNPLSTVRLGEVPRAIAPLVQAHDELNRLGIVLRDPFRGLVDFHHERDGRLVYLCYVSGEPDLAFWHELDAGFQGRQPLEG